MPLLQVEKEEERMEAEGVDYLGRPVFANVSSPTRESRWFKLRLAAASVRRIMAAGSWRRSVAVTRTAPAP